MQFPAVLLLALLCVCSHAGNLHPEVLGFLQKSRLLKKEKSSINP